MRGATVERSGLSGIGLVASRLQSAVAALPYSYHASHISQLTAISTLFAAVIILRCCSLLPTAMRLLTAVCVVALVACLAVVSVEASVTCTKTTNREADNT